MRRARHAALWFAPFLLLCAHDARAENPPSAAELYAQGRYDAAIAAGEMAGDGDNLTIAAEAALAETSAGDALCLDCAKQAEALAHRAIAADAGQARAFVSLVRAIGFESRSVGVIASLPAHYAEQAKRAAETALKLAPGDAWALAAMGGWHVEVVRSCGSLLGSLFYGARLSAGIDLLQRARAAAPGDPAVTLYYALLLSSVAYAVHRDEIAAALAQAAGAMPHDAYPRMMQSRAARLLDLLKQDRLADYLKLANVYLGVSAHGQ